MVPALSGTLRLRDFVLATLRAYRAEVLKEPQPGAAVACGTCRACCRTFDVEVKARDNEREPTLQITGKWRTNRYGEGITTLQHQPDGTCAHLTPEGCAVYATRPDTCRTFDCRTYGVLRLGSLAQDPARAANFEVFNREAFARAAADIAAPLGVDEAAWEHALNQREQGQDTGAAAIQGVLVLAMFYAFEGGDAEMRAIVQELDKATHATAAY